MKIPHVLFSSFCPARHLTAKQNWDAAALKVGNVAQISELSGRSTKWCRQIGVWVLHCLTKLWRAIHHHNFHKNFPWDAHKFKKMSNFIFLQVWRGKTVTCFNFKKRSFCLHLVKSIPSKEESKWEEMQYHSIGDKCATARWKKQS